MPSSISKRYFGLALVVIMGLLLAGLTLLTFQPQASAGDCANRASVTHQIIIKSDRVLPKTTVGVQCDKLTFTNEDDITREIAFGPHQHHVPYDGVTEKFINKNQSFTITLDQTGKFSFHDHIHDEVVGYFDVNKS